MVAPPLLMITLLVQSSPANQVNMNVERTEKLKHEYVCYKKLWDKVKQTEEMGKSIPDLKSLQPDPHSWICTF